MRAWWILVFALAGLAGEARASAAIGAQLVQDINAAPVRVDSAPRGFQRVGDTVYFSAYRIDSGRELFAIRPEWAVPLPVADLAPGAASSNLAILGRIGNTLVLRAEVGKVGLQGNPYDEQLWAFDVATRALTRLTQQPPQTLDSAGHFQRVGDSAGRLLVADTAERSLWTTDGTPSGTQRVFLGTDPRAPFEPDSVCLFPDRFLFSTRGANDAREFWLSDGSPAGTRLLHRLVSTRYPYAAAGSDGICYWLLASSGMVGWQLWRSDGTEAGTQLVRESATSTPVSLASLQGVAFVLENTTADEFRLWPSNQEAPMLTLPGAAPTSSAIRVGDRFAFLTRAVDGRTVVMLSDGTSAGTRQLLVAGKPVRLGGYPSLSAADGRLFARDEITFWRVDMENYSAVPMPGWQGFTPAIFVGDTAIGSGWDPQRGSEVWRAQGFAPVEPIPDQTRSTGSIQRVSDAAVAVVGDVLVFPVSIWDSVTEHRSLWRTDGSVAGTRELPQTAYEGNAHSVARLGDGVLFATEGAGGASPRRAWRADAQLAAATPVSTALNYGGPQDTRTGGLALFTCAAASAPSGLCGLRASQAEASLLAQVAGAMGMVPIDSIGEVALFLYGNGLWRSDGTAPGTYQLVQGIFVPGPRALMSTGTGSRLLFSLCRSWPGSGCLLYISDGSLAGTSILQSTTSSIYSAIAAADGYALFGLTSTYNELFATNGTVAGTRLLRRTDGIGGMASAGRYVHMALFGNEANQNSYAVSDGTDAGTRTIALPPGFVVAQGARPTALDAGTVVFQCRSEATGTELCAVDADGSNARLAVDFYPGPDPGSPEPLAQTASAAYFLATDGEHGREVWHVAVLGDAIFRSRFEVP
ncbi:hypothetical protein [Tahibacter caeni]|uniref:hypothetical protein n=1 Tax=Tahibacter caeni TaxID=1453545 RepID=UPI0021491655|nr:hypothetical protein [Tahibacter caeni]